MKYRLNYCYLLRLQLIIMKIEPNQIQLSRTQKQTYITLTNFQSTAYTFKIKTNNLEVISASPSHGILQSGTKKQILIKILTQKQFQAKVLISYLKHIQINGQSIPKPKTMNSNFIIPIKRKMGLQIIAQQQNQSSKVSQSEFSLKTEKFRHINMTEYKKDSSNQFWQKKFKEQYNTSVRLKTKLGKIQQKLILVEKEDINLGVINDVQKDSQRIELNFNHIIIGCLFLFLVGYFIGNSF